MSLAPPPTSLLSRNLVKLSLFLGNVTIGLLKSIENKFNELPISFVGDDVVVSKSISLDCWQLGILDSTEGNSLCKCSKTLCAILD